MVRNLGFIGGWGEGIEYKLKISCKIKKILIFELKKILKMKSQKRKIKFKLTLNTKIGCQKEF